MRKKLLFFGLLLCMLTVGLTPGLPAISAYAAETAVKITTDKDTYRVGDQVQVNGFSPTGKDITLKVIDSNKFMVHVDASYGKDNKGTFAFAFSIPATSATEMTIIAGYGSGQGEFDIRNIKIGSPAPTGPIGGPGGSLPNPPDTKTDNANNNSVSLTSAMKETVQADGITVSLEASKLSELLSKSSADAKVFVLEVKSAPNAVKAEFAYDVLQLLTSKNAAAVVQLQTGAGSYDLPIKQIDLAASAGQLGVDPKDLKVNITIQKVQGDNADAVKSIASKLGADVVVEPLEFSVTVVAGNGKSQEIAAFNTYIARSITLTKSVNPKTATGVRFNPETGTYSPVPTLFEGLKATFLRKGNSIYTVIDHPKTFGDLTSHWAKDDVETLASKLILNGIEEDKFAPNNRITRAEFAAMLVRSLGLDEVKATGFKDVAAADWFSGSVGASQKAGLINGYEDGTFKPDALISREQMATMVIRALKVAEKEVAVDASSLNKFADRNSVSSWSKDAVAQAITTGIVQGVTDTSFAPQDNATRAQGAAMLKRMLEYLKFIN
ncbi:S-layer homology domain-containing protein [Paenibacillus planticolens]|uniref:SLH domain-containing protein n=1 Tax=Paenibacillus planticolens TaxID=2654976 RepID=A0ABX1ZIA4_9BACL|nr:S-layer homology domain-containing protein [Paenibacillus planticolens]NOU99805.1 hypothetical protein [Paenibacillus planticolens]